MSLSHQSVLVEVMKILPYFFDEKCETKKKDPPLGMILCSLSPFSQKMERWIDVFIESVGTDGARTRSFRLDRAVLWPIELQSQEN